ASKALGGYGGLLCGTRDGIRRLQAGSPWYQGATPPPAPVAAATAAGLRVARTEPELRTRLAANTARLRDGLAALGLRIDDLPTPIVPLRPDGARDPRALAARLEDRGILVPYLATYAGAGDGGALRIAVTA